MPHTWLSLGLVQVDTLVRLQSSSELVSGDAIEQDRFKTRSDLLLIVPRRSTAFYFPGLQS